MAIYVFKAKIMKSTRELQRSRSLHVVLMDEGGRVFDVLKEAGVVYTGDHLTALQRLPGRRVDATFKMERMKEQFLPVLRRDQRVVVTAYSSLAKVVTVLHCRKFIVC